MDPISKYLEHGTLADAPRVAETEDLSSELNGRLADYLLLLWARRRFVRNFLLAVLLISLATAFLLPKYYEAKAQLMPPDSAQTPFSSILAAVSGGSGSSGMSGLGGMAIADVLGAKTNGALFVGVLGSRTVQDQIIDRFYLRRVYDVSTYEKARKKLSAHTSIEEDRKSGIIRITVEDKDPRRARDIAAAYVDELNRIVAKVSTSAARRERVFLEERLKQVDSELQRAQQELSVFSSGNSTLDLKEQSKAMIEAAGTLEGELIAAQTDLSSLQQIYASDNIRIRTVEARIGELKRRLKQITGSESPDPEMPYPSMRQLPLLGVKYVNLYREVRVQETVYEALTRQYELAKVQEAKEIPTVRVLDEPVLPEKKSWPPRALLIASSLVLGALFAACWVLLSDAWHRIEPSDPLKQVMSKAFGRFGLPSKGGRILVNRE